MIVKWYYSYVVLNNFTHSTETVNILYARPLLLFLKDGEWIHLLNMHYSFWKSGGDLYTYFQRLSMKNGSIDQTFKNCLCVCVCGGGGEGGVVI